VWQSARTNLHLDQGSRLIVPGKLDPRTHGAFQLIHNLLRDAIGPRGRRSKAALVLAQVLRRCAGIEMRWHGDRRGSMLVWMSFLMIPLMGFVGLGVDTGRGYMVRARLSQALDSAALVAGRSTADQAGAEARARIMFKANLPPGYMDATVTGPTFTFNNTDHTVKVAASAVVPTYFLHLIGHDTVTVSVDTEVQRNANSLEIALVLDVTGSMSGSKILDLKLAAKDLIDTVVWDDQSQYYSKIAIIPYSNSVNLSAQAAQVRGVIPPSKPITGATRGYPVIVTSAGHGLNNGDKVFIAGVNGMTQMNNNANNSTTASTSPQYWVVANKTTNTFALTRSNGSSADGGYWSNYSSAGSIHCTVAGCQYYQFTNAYAGSEVFQASTCVSERTGAEAYTDAAPSTALAGRVYPASNNPCVASTILPLTPDKTVLRAKVDALTISGSTAGQIGMAWGWYMISPNFAYLWPGPSAPAAYGTQELIKIAVIMTDGEFNTPYCNGVISRDAGSGSGNAEDHINCNATNGNATSQALQQCAAMKAQGIIVFTVGFELDSQVATDMMKQCASGLSYAYVASNGAALKEAFRSIAINISRLRISK
jgi:Flp pilus assembly protein TadG